MLYVHGRRHVAFPNDVFSGKKLLWFKPLYKLNEEVDMEVTEERDP